MKKPELLVTPRAVADIEPLVKAGADAVMVGEQKFGLRLAGEFSREDVKQAVNIAHENGVKVYVAMNAMFHNDKVEELTDYVAFLNEVNVDAIVFGDPAVLMAVREVAPNMPLHWNTETTATNWFTCKLLGANEARNVLY